MFKQIVSIVVFLLAALSLTSPIHAQQRDVMLVLDASNSMWGQIDGKNKIVIAREVVRDVLGDIPSDVRLGILAYGHRSEGDCGDIETVVPVGPVDSSAYMSVIDGISPKGRTPLTEAVRRAAEALKYTDVPATVILVSDGIETCNADPCALAAELESAGIDFTAHVVGFDVSAEEAASFSCLAELTGGQFFQARNAGELTDALDTAVQEVAAAEPEPQPEPVEQPAHTGPNLKLSAVPAEGMEPLQKGPYWVISEPQADASGKRKEVKRSGSALPELELPPGRYWVEVSHKQARQGREIEIPENGVAEEVFVFGAGRLTIVALPSEGAEPLGQAYWIVYSAAKDMSGKREEIARSGSAKADFFLPAGDYYVEGQFKSAKAGKEVSVEAGKLTEEAVVLGAGMLVVSASVTENGDPLDDVMFIVQEANADLSGKRKEIARSARQIAEFGLPAGKYRVVATTGEAEGSTEVEVAANQRTERQIVIDLGALQLKTSVTGLSGEPSGVPIRYDVYSATKDMSGKRTSITASTRPVPVFRLPSGDYFVVARLGSQNVRAEADVKVSTGQLAEVAIEQQAGFVKFVVDGDPSDRVRWDVMDASGQKVGASVREELDYVLAPGDYEVRLTVGDTATTETFSIGSAESKEIRVAPPS
ncbi:VWA domain-containing protein [Microbaculum marinum]|uniref:VWA domain-containing protein n=1 Tax=Microbaculum marinum TaxID=1764581 RepID=A0AAW9RMB9_9HYPH